MHEKIDKLEPDSDAFIHPQRSRADIVVAFQPGDDPNHLDAILTLREGLPHPDLSSMVDEHGQDPIPIEEAAGERRLHVAGDIDREHGAAIEEAIWEQMHFARHLHTEQLGTFEVGSDPSHRSESLAITQVLILYHMVTAKAAVAVGGAETGQRTSSPGVPSAA